MGRSKKKRKEEINLSKSSLWYLKPKREEHLFSMQLISQEKNPATEINHFKGSGPEWLVPRGTPFFTFGRGQDFWKGEREITYWCMPAKLTLSVFFFLSLFSVFPLIFLFFFFSCYSSFLFRDFQVFNSILFLIVIIVTVYSKGFFL